jgi:hypothetical protein
MTLICNHSTCYLSHLPERVEPRSCKASSLSQNTTGHKRHSREGTVRFIEAYLWREVYLFSFPVCSWTRRQFCCKLPYCETERTSVTAHDSQRDRAGQHKQRQQLGCQIRAVKLRSTERVISYQEIAENGRGIYNSHNKNFQTKCTHPLTNTFNTF